MSQQRKKNTPSIILTLYAQAYISLKYTKNETKNETKRQPAMLQGWFSIYVCMYMIYLQTLCLAFIDEFPSKIMWQSFPLKFHSKIPLVLPSLCATTLQEKY